MTEKQFTERVRSSLKDFMVSINQSFSREDIMMFSINKYNYKDHISFVAGNKINFQSNEHFKVVINYHRRFDLIENVWFAYYPEKKIDDLWTLSFYSGENNYIDVPNVLFLHKKVPEVVQKSKDFIMESYFKINKKMEDISTFEKLNGIYNYNINEPFLEVSTKLPNSPFLLFRRLIIAFFSEDTSFDNIYEKNREELLVVKNRFPLLKDWYEKMLFVYDDLYQRMKNGDIERPLNLIEIPS